MSQFVRRALSSTKAKPIISPPERSNKPIEVSSTKYLNSSLFRKARDCPRKLVYASTPSTTSLFPTTSDLDYQEKIFGQWLFEERKKIERYAQAVLFPRGVSANEVLVFPKEGVDSSCRKGLHGEASVLVQQQPTRIANDFAFAGKDTLPTEKELIDRTHNFILHHIQQTRGASSSVDDNNGITETDNNTLFNGMVKGGLCVASPDILQWKDGTLHLFGVGGKSWDSRKSRDEQFFSNRRSTGDTSKDTPRKISSSFLLYLQEIAFQTMTVQQAFPDIHIATWIILPDKSKKNIDIPNLHILFHQHDNGSNSNNTLTEILKTHEPLIAKVEVTDVVDHIIHDYEFKYPGSDKLVNHRPTENDKKHFVSSFRHAINEWTETILNQQSSIALQNVVPTIGSHCKTCEYRLTDFDKNSSKVTAKLSKNITNERQAMSGFDECWTKAMGSSTDKKYFDPKRRPVCDLWYGGKSITRLLDKNKFYIDDIKRSDLGLTSQTAIEATKKGGKRKGWSRAERQWKQVQLDSLASNDKSGSEENETCYAINREYILEEMKHWKYPLHFIDFETIAPALPYTINRRPFDVLAFQFSHHVLEENDGLPVHRSEFLHIVPGECPNASFLNALAKSLGNCDGTVFRWAAHENTVLAALLQEAKSSSANKVLEEQVSDETIHVLEPLLQGKERSMIDLMQVATKGYYVRGSNGSSSIKRLVAPTMEASNHLRQLYGSSRYNSNNFVNMQWFQVDDHGNIINPYDLLKAMNEHEFKQQADQRGDNVVVTDGGDAMYAYHMIQTQTKDSSSSLNNDTPNEGSMNKMLKRSLLRYCELDTLAMAMIVQAWKEFVK